MKVAGPLSREDLLEGILFTYISTEIIQFFSLNAYWLTLLHDNFIDD